MIREGGLDLDLALHEEKGAHVTTATIGTGEEGALSLTLPETDTVHADDID